MHLLRTKTIGGEIFAESHAQVRPYISVTQGHEIAHRIVERVEAVVPALKELTVHIDPEDDEHDAPELPNCSDLEDKIRKIWSSHHDSGELQAVTLHILHSGVEVVLRIAPELDAKFDTVSEEVISLDEVSKVEFVSLR